MNLPIAPALLEELKAIVGDQRVSTSAAVREQHGKDESYHPPIPPDAVVFATSTEEVAAVVRACAAADVPIIPFGTGTSLEGHVTAVLGGVTISLSEMNAVLEVNPEDMDCRVQAGVTRKQLNEHLRDTGLFYPVDPGADASLGGMTATGASGTTTVRYGAMKDNVLGLTVVTPSGEIVRTGGRARKSSAGYDLTRLFVGSEGTLGVITEVSLRLYGIPEAMSSAVCAFPTVEDAINSVILTIQSGVPVARIEFLDEIQIDAVNKYSKLDNPVAPTLFFEFHGTDAGVVEQAEQVGAIAGEFGGSDFRWATRTEDRNQLWQARHDTLYATMALRPGCECVITDVCVPISRLAECLAETRADIDQSGMLVSIVGHVGDGNFHCLILVDHDKPEELEGAEALNERLVRRAIAAGGTCTGEHGVGTGKMAYLEAEQAEALPMMRALKQAWDPANIMNPGKIFRLDA